MFFSEKGDVSVKMRWTQVRQTNPHSLTYMEKKDESARKNIFGDISY